MSQQWPGGLIRKTPVTPTGPYQNGAAPGVWTLDQVAYWQKQGLWPIAGNSLGWIASISETATVGGPGFNNILLDSSYLYIGARSSLSASQPSVIAKLPVASPTLTWATYYYKGTGGISDSVSSIFISSGYAYCSVVTNGTTPYFNKYDISTGALSAQYTSTYFNGNTQGGPVCIDSSANLYVAYRANNGSGPYKASATKFNSALTAQWGYVFYNPTNYGKGNYGACAFENSFVDSSGYVYFGGHLSGSGDSNYAGCAGIVKLDSSGTVQWSKQIGAVGSGSTQTAHVGTFQNGAGNILFLCAVSGTTTGIYIFEVSPSTGAYTGTIKKSLTFTGNTGYYTDATSTKDSSGNVYVFMTNSTTEMWIAKIDSTISTVTAIKMTLSSGGSISPYGITTDGTNLCLSMNNAAGNRLLYLKIPCNISAMVGASAVLSGTTYSFSAATGSLATNTFSSNPTATLTRDVGMSTWSSGTQTLSSKSPVVTSASF